MNINLHIPNSCTEVNIDGDIESGIMGMLIGQPEVTGVTFQRPVTPPPIVLGTQTGMQPIETMEIYTGNEHFNSHTACMFPMFQ